MRHLLNLLLAEFVLFLLVIQEGGQLLLLLGHNLLLKFLLICEQSLHLGDTRRSRMRGNANLAQQLFKVSAWMISLSSTVINSFGFSRLNTLMQPLPTDCLK